MGTQNAHARRVLNGDLAFQLLVRLEDLPDLRAADAVLGEAPLVRDVVVVDPVALLAEDPVSVKRSEKGTRTLEDPLTHRSGGPGS